MQYAFTSKELFDQLQTPNMPNVNECNGVKNKVFKNYF